VKKTWAESWGEADRTCGADLPSAQSLPHMGERAGIFAANLIGPNGERPIVKPSMIGRILSVFTRGPEDELEKLRRMLAEVNPE
jgi:hypothetical protein